MSWGYAILYTLAPLGQNHLTSNPYITDTCTTNGDISMLPNSCQSTLLVQV